MKYRVHLQARWPTYFHTLTGAIAFIRCNDPLWYGLDEHTDTGWEVLVHAGESRVNMARAVDEGISEDEL